MRESSMPLEIKDEFKFYDLKEALIERDSPHDGCHDI